MIVNSISVKNGCRLLKQRMNLLLLLLKQLKKRIEYADYAFCTASLIEKLCFNLLSFCQREFSVYDSEYTMRSALVYNYFWLRDKNSTEEMLKEAVKEQIA